MTSRHLQQEYPWTKWPLIASAPMAKVAMPKLAVSVSKAGGLGFIAAGYHSDALEDLLEEAHDMLGGEVQPASQAVKLSVGIGFITWSASLDTAMPAFDRFWPCAVWLFAPPSGFRDLEPWATRIRNATSNHTKIWVQIGSVCDAVEAVNAVSPDVLVVQGVDAGGHSLAAGASIVSLVPEVVDKLSEMGQGHISVMAAGGICDGRGVAAAAHLGAHGCVMGTRFLASPESLIPRGYQQEVIQASDGGLSTVRTTIYDKVRDIHGWPKGYDGRGLINKTYIESTQGLSEVRNRELYREAQHAGDGAYGRDGRLVTYAGTGVGLIKEVQGAGDIVMSVRGQAHALMAALRAKL